MNLSDSIVLSVRDLVDFSFRSGSLYSTSFIGSSHLLDGIEGHKVVQSSRPSSYQKEVSISGTIDYAGFSFLLRGRIDGLYLSLDHFVLEEIKTTTRPLSSLTPADNPHYWAQAKCYAYLYAREHNLSHVIVQLCYYNIQTGTERLFSELYSFDQLERFVYSLLDSFLAWHTLVLQELERRNSSLTSLSFPFPSFRQGQKEMVDFVYSLFSSGEVGFCQAPTGIGKTIAVLYPALLRLCSHPSTRIFYLTSKTTQKAIAEETLDILRKQGVKIKSVTLTAKSEICLKDSPLCDPSLCEYADGHFDRINGAIKDIFTRDTFTREQIVKYARKHRVCPFEFSLDLSTFADCIICDYNYVFDPQVKLRRFFGSNSDDSVYSSHSFLFLIDEAHNLVDRAREMFSAELDKRTFLDLSRKTKTAVPSLSKTLQLLNKHMLQFRKECEEKKKKEIAFLSPPEKRFLKTLKTFLVESEEWLALNLPSDFREDLLDLYFNVRHFLNIIDLYDSNYVTYYSTWSKGNLVLKLFCIDPSPLISKELKKSSSTVFFSATLSPLDYYINLLIGERKRKVLQLTSPFPQENFLLLINDSLSTRYRDRSSTYEEVVENICSFVQSKKGNFMVYFPSYEYLNNVVPLAQEKMSTTEIVIQDPEMGEKERALFLKKFQKYGKRTLVGFAVMGGVFGEAIDLVGEKLSGVVIVGVGLPKINFERELIKQYFDAKLKQGFHYSYTFPGLNRVLQAVGRLIRTEKDKGIALLIDDRFTNFTYKQLLPEYWSNYAITRSSEEIEEKTKNFWKEKKTKEKTTKTKEKTTKKKKKRKN